MSQRHVPNLLWVRTHTLWARTNYSMVLMRHTKSSAHLVTPLPVKRVSSASLPEVGHQTHRHAQTQVGFVSPFDSEHDKIYKITCAPSEDSDQSGHPPSMTRLFDVCLKNVWVLSYPKSTQRKLWSDWVFAGRIGHFFYMLRLICRHFSIA